MNNTLTEEAEKIRETYMEMTGEQRMLIGMQMFETERKIVLSSFSEDISEYEKRRLLCEHFYGSVSEKAFPE